MTDFNINLTQAPIGARLPRFLQTTQAPTGGGPTYAQDQLNVTPAGGAGVDPTQIQQQLQSQNPADRFRAVVAITNLPPAQAIPLLQMAAQNDNAQVRDLANQALGVMQRMPGATQPATNQPQPTQPQYQPTQPQYQAPAYTPSQAAPVPQFQMPQGQAIAADDVAFMLQMLQTDLSGPNSTQAVQQLGSIAQQHPQHKEAVLNLLLNHVYNTRDSSMPTAIQVLAAMGDQRALPYIEHVYRSTGYAPEVYPVALQAIQAMRGAGAQPGTASVAQNLATPEYIRILELEMKSGGAKGLAAFEQIRATLGADPRAQSPIRQEVLRVMLTHIASSSDGTVAPACALLGAMGTREMDTLRYLDAVRRDPGKGPEANRAAEAAIKQIMAMPR